MSRESKGQVVGALVCQQNSYLQSLDTEVISCVKFTPPAVDNDAKKKPKTARNSAATQDMWLIEFQDSVLFPEGTSYALTSLFFD